MLRGQPVQHKNGRGPCVLRSTTGSVWPSLRRGTEPRREAFVEGLGVSNSSGRHGRSGLVWVLFEFAKQLWMFSAKFILWPKIKACFYVLP